MTDKSDLEQGPNSPVKPLTDEKVAELNQLTPAERTNYKDNLKGIPRENNLIIKRLRRALGTMSQILTTF